MNETTQPEVRIQAPAIVFPGAATHHSTAYRTAHDLLARRAPREALEVLEPALEEEPANRGLRSLRAWAYLMRAQLQKAYDELRVLVDEDPSDAWTRHRARPLAGAPGEVRRGSAAPAPRGRHDRRPRARVRRPAGRATCRQGRLRRRVS